MTPDSFTVTRTATIDAEPSRIDDQIVDFHQWTGWSPWEDLDPELKRSYSGPESGPGAVYAWSGNRKAGQGRMEITNATEPSLVAADVIFEKGLARRKATSEGPRQN